MVNEYLTRGPRILNKERELTGSEHVEIPGDCRGERVWKLCVLCFSIWLLLSYILFLKKKKKRKEGRKKRERGGERKRKKEREGERKKERKERRNGNLVSKMFL